MSHKLKCFILVFGVLLCCITTARAAGEDGGYDAARQTLALSGVSGGAELALSGDSVWQMAIDMGLLQSSETLSLSALSTQTLQAQQSLLHAQAQQTAQAVSDAALALQYGGAQVTAYSATLYAEPDGNSAALRTAVNGKVLRLLGAEGDWYRVCFAGVTGYVPAAQCCLVVYADYEGTWASGAVEEEIIAYARTFSGTPYVYGGSSKSGTDCSGFTMAVFAPFGYTLPHGASDQYDISRHISDYARQAGDLVFFNTCGGVSHVGLYLGDGLFIHASSSRGVTVNSLYESYYAAAYIGAGRVID
ncbi:MAG: C40 family peptidase [Oscillospiraceae bacterium]|nr:C40 family peptidase [Oscillospiraceae bacterium]